MKFPIIVLSYGEFSQTYKLFMYENNGISILPIFYNPETIIQFVKYMQNILREFGDNRQLCPQVCNNKGMANDMFKVISSMCQESIAIAIDPLIIDNKIECEMIDIDVVIDQIDGVI